MKNSKFKTEYKLKQHTMLLHFQAKPSSGENVCLRASEVKPKLDRFILKKLGEIKTVKEKYSSWIQAEHLNEKDVAFKYRMTIVRCSERMNIYETDHRTRRDRNNGVPGPNFVLPDIYYGNMGDGPKKYGVFFIDGLKIQITCFIPDLKKFIEENIAEFFAVTNFGTMQNKGFGSFTIDREYINYEDALVNKYTARICLKATIRCSGESSRAQSDLFKMVKDIYSVMKSGQNYGRSPYIRSCIYKYMHEEHQMGNEKAWMKRENIAPIRTTHKMPVDTPESHEHFKVDSHKCYYVRALLGIGEHLEWYEPKNEEINGRSRKEKIEIKEVNDEIKRVASPVFFKIVDNVIYITADEPNLQIYNKEFSFRNKGYTKQRDGISPRLENEGYISTPDQGMNFSMKDFLKYFVTYYNNERGNRLTIIKELEV